MKYILNLIFIAALSISCKDNNANSSCPVIEVRFSPNGGATEEIVRQIDDAKKSVLVQAFSFSSAPIIDALVKAKHRGVDVEIILDKGDALGSRMPILKLLKENDVKVYLDGHHQIAHNKVMIIDAGITFTGSLNFTKAADNGNGRGNAENSIKLDESSTDKHIVNQYIDNWKAHKQHSPELDL